MTGIQTNTLGGTDTCIDCRQNATVAGKCAKRCSACIGRLA
jgi:hypothetical protein